MPRGVRRIHGPHQLLPPPAGRLGGGRLWAGRRGGHATHGVWPLHGSTHLRCTLWHHKVFSQMSFIKLIYLSLYHSPLTNNPQRRICSADHLGLGWPPGSRQVHQCLWPPASVPGCRYTYWSSYCRWALLKMTIKHYMPIIINSGVLFDHYQSYNSGFILMGGMITLSGMMLYPIPCIERVLNQDNKHEILEWSLYIYVDLGTIK